MPNQMKFAVISDLHIGSQARAEDFCTKHEIKEKEKKYIEKDYLNQFKKLVEDKNIRAEYLLVSGDISSVADMRQFGLGSELVCQIAQFLSVSEDKIFFVPGNHDVDWGVLSAGGDPKLRESQRYDPLSQKGTIFYKRNTIANGNLLCEPYFGSWENDDVCVVAYNSSWNDRPDSDIHCGEISRDHVALISDHIEILENTNDKLKVFLVHHHPLPYSNPISEHDFSAMQNSDLLLNVLSKYKFDLLVHGHKHNPKFTVHRFNDGAPLVILGAGSFSVALGTEWTEHVHNQFHLIDVHGRQANNFIRGRVFSWAYTCSQGWKKSNLKTGIEHERSFGAYYFADEIKSKVAAKVKQEINNKGWVKWRELLTVDDEYQYLPVQIVEQVINELSKELGLTCHRQEDINEYILLNGVDE